MKPLIYIWVTIELVKGTIGCEMSESEVSSWGDSQPLSAAPSLPCALVSYDLHGRDTEGIGQSKAGGAIVEPSKRTAYPLPETYPLLFLEL